MYLLEEKTEMIKKMSVEEFQALNRIGQIRELVSDRIKEGYSVEDFQKDYRASKADIEDFKRISAEILSK